MRVSFCSLSSLSFAGNQGLSLTLNGKEVKSVSVDKLGSINFKISLDKTFKQFYAGQWGSLNNALIVVSQIFKKGGSVPDLSKNYSESVNELANTYDDASWGNQKSLTKSMLPIAKTSRWYRAGTDENIAIGVRFSRKEYTGKTIWKNGGWVKETKWSDVGPVFASTVLSLEAPPFANKIDWSSMTQQAVDALNSKEQSPTTFDNTTALVKSIYAANAADNFEGSKTLSAKKSGNPIYYWNYEEGNDNQYIFASVPVEVNIHAVKKNGMMGAIEHDFKCNTN